MADSIAVAVLAKAPVAGLAKSRLVPALGATGAALLQARLTERAIENARNAGIGPITLWATPDDTHPLFASLRKRFGVALAQQPEGDLGERMHAAVVAANGPVLVVGTDCPALSANHLKQAAGALRHVEVVIIPAEDGGYVLIGLRQPHAALFTDMVWGTAAVISETRRRLRTLGLTWHEFDALWDVDTPADLERLGREQPSLFGPGDGRPP